MRMQVGAREHLGQSEADNCIQLADPPLAPYSASHSLSDQLEARRIVREITYFLWTVGCLVPHSEELTPDHRRGFSNP